MDIDEKFKGSGTRSCGCKGIRSCFVCNPVIKELLGHKVQSEHSIGVNDKSDVPTNQRVYDYCICCGLAWLNPTYATIKTNSNYIGNTGNESNNGIPSTSMKGKVNDCELENKPDAQFNTCYHGNPDSQMAFPGIMVIEDFINEEEETFLDSEIYKTVFVNSQSGRRKQDFGPKVNFKKQKLKTANFSGLPFYSKFLFTRMTSYPVLGDFRPVEMCNLEYMDKRGAHIEPHFDDFWLWGERLVTVNLMSSSALTFSIDSQPDMFIRVPMPRRSLIVVSGPARCEWKHSIQLGDIEGRRIAMTFRELSAEFKSLGLRQEEGQSLLDLALTFEGLAVGS